jgi:hypothetical protein
MRKAIFTIILVLLCSASYGFTFDVGTEYATQYVYRGQRLIDSPTLSPFVAISGENVELKAARIYDMDKHDYFKNEFQLTLKTQIDKAKVGVGLLRHDNLNGNVQTNEFFVNAAWEGAFRPFVAVYFDFDKGTGQYVQAGVEKTLVKGKNAINLGGKVSYLINNSLMGLDNAGKEFTGAYNGELYLSSKFNVGKHIIAEPMIGYTFPLSEDAKDAIERLSIKNKENTLYGGITLTASF